MDSITVGGIDIGITGEFAGIALGQRGRTIVGRQNSKLAVLFDADLWQYREIRAIWHMPIRRIRLNDEKFARAAFLTSEEEIALMEHIIAQMNAWDGVDRNASLAKVAPGTYGPFTVSLQDDGDYLVSAKRGSHSPLKACEGAVFYAEDAVWYIPFTSEDALAGVIERAVKRIEKAAANPISGDFGPYQASTGSDGYFVLLVDRSDREAGDAMQSLRGSRWDREKRGWRVSFSSRKGLLSLLEAKTAEFMQMREEVFAEPLTGTYGCVDVITSASGHRISFPYDHRLVSEIKQIAGARWLADSRVWLVPHSRTEEARAFAERVAKLEGKQQAAAAEAKETASARQQAEDEAKLAKGWVKFCRRSRGKGDGHIGQIVWKDGEPYELVENARKWFNAEPSSILTDEGPYFEANECWCWNAWGRPLPKDRRDKLVAEREAEMARLKAEQEADLAHIQKCYAFD